MKQKTQIFYTNPGYACNIFLLLIAFCLGCEKQNTWQKNVIHGVIMNPPETFDPRLTTTELASNLSQLVYAPLVVLDDKLTIKPMLAQKIIQMNATTYDVVLRDNLFFHDRTALTAEDVVYTFAHLDDDDVHSPEAANFNYFKKITALSKHHVRFELTRPHAPFWYDIRGIGIVSKKNCYHRSLQCRNEHVGSGPFELFNVDTTKERYFLKPFALWFEGAPVVDGIEFRVVRDATTRLLELISGKADFVEAGGISPWQLIAVEQYPFLHEFRKPGLKYSYLAMNLRPPKNPNNNIENEADRTRRALSNPKVRRAIAHSLDVKTIAAAKFRGGAIVATGMIPPNHWAKDPTLKAIEYDPKKAKQLLELAGLNDRGTKHHGRFHMVLRTGPDRFRQSLIQVFASYLRVVGIDVSIRVQDTATLFQDIRQGNFEMFSAIWTPVVDPDLHFFVFHSSNIPDSNHAGGNRGAYIDPIADALIVKGRETIDIKQRAAIYQQLERYLQTTLPYIPLWFDDVVMVMNQRIKGFEQSRSGSLFNFRHAYVEKS